MKRIVVVVALAAAAFSAAAATAVFTGRSEMVQTVTGRMAWRCWYNYAGNTFSQVHENFCPGTVEVQ